MAAEALLRVEMAVDASLNVGSPGKERDPGRFGVFMHSSVKRDSSKGRGSKGGIDVGLD